MAVADVDLETLQSEALTRTSVRDLTLSSVTSSTRFVNGVAPPVRSLDLPVEAGGQDSVLRRSEPFRSAIEHRVVGLLDVRERRRPVVRDRRGRLFARNIRGFLGTTAINEAMENTLANKPEYFWYFNNGVTIVCDNAQRIQQKGREVLRVDNPQVIQRTTDDQGAGRRRGWSQQGERSCSGDSSATGSRRLD